MLLTINSVDETKAIKVKGFATLFKSMLYSKEEELTMSTKTNNSTAVKEGNVTVKGLEGLKTLMGSGSPILQNEDEVVKMKAKSEWTKEVAATLISVADMYGNNTKDLSTDLLGAYLEWVILNRINYVQNGRNAIHPRNIKYPTVMFDALSKMGRFEGVTTIGANIVPEVADEDIMSQSAMDAVNAWADKDSKLSSAAEWVKDGKIIEFPRITEFERLMQVAGIELASGLPMTRTVVDEKMYQMQISDTGEITTAGETPDISAVFARCFCQFNAVSTLFGKQKVELMFYKAMESALFDIMRGYVKNFRG